MTRSHPPSLIQRTLRTLREETDLRRGDVVVVGASGGPDSTALLHVLHTLRSTLGVAVRALGVDHGLRPDAARELDIVQGVAHDLGVPFERTAVNVDRTGNLHASARQARYAALDAQRLRLGARWVATAHHAGDRAETVLMRVLRGSGPEGLAVLPACSHGRLRPFIRSSKSDILAHLRRHHLPFADDPSNVDRRFLRTRVRLEALPLLENICPGAEARLNDLADALTERPLPDIVDPQGRPVVLGRAQRRELWRLLDERRAGAVIWLKGGLEIRIPETPANILVAQPRAAPPHNLARPTSGAEKARAGDANQPKSD